MASSYSDLGLELMVTGENAGTWGDKTNTNLNLIQQAIAGYEEVSIAGGAQTTALAMTDATISNARNMVIKLTGTITGNQIVTIPDSVEKFYTVVNGTTGAFTVQFKTVSGNGPTFAADDKNIKFVYSDGTDIVDITGDLSKINVKGIAADGSSNYFTVPSTDGTADQAIVTDGSGNLSFDGPYATTGKAIAMALVFG